MSSEDLGKANEFGQIKIADIEGQITRTDSKAIGALSGLAILAGIIGFAILTSEVALVARVFGVVGFISLACALTSAVAVLWPRTGPNINATPRETETMLLALSASASTALSVTAVELVDRTTVFDTKNRWTRICLCFVVATIVAVTVSIGCALFL